jgi:hypothetical protein
MRTRREFYLIASIWELIRFCFLFLAVWMTFRKILETNNQAIYWLLVFGNGGLLVAAALLFIYVNPMGNHALLNLARMGKILGLLSAILLIVFEPISTGWQFLSVRIFSYPIAPLSVLLVITIADLIFVFLLFSFQEEESAQ